MMHTRLVHYMIQFLPWCDKCLFKGKTQGDLQRHILWIHEGKGPQFDFCDYRPTKKLAMTKHIELIHGQLHQYLRAYVSPIIRGKKGCNVCDRM